MNMILTEEPHMKKNTLAVVFLLSCCFLQAQTSKDIGESKEYKALKERMSAPGAADIDKSVTLDELLAKTGEKDLPQTKAAVVEGNVIQTEKEEDGDYHLVLAAKTGETDTKKWVIVEVTPAWQKCKSSTCEIA
jgi:hypothetical protein